MPHLGSSWSLSTNEDTGPLYQAATDAVMSLNAWESVLVSV